MRVPGRDFGELSCRAFDRYVEGNRSWLHQVLTVCCVLATHHRWVGTGSKIRVERGVNAACRTADPAQRRLGC